MRGIENKMLAINVEDAVADGQLNNSDDDSRQMISVAKGSYSCMYIAKYRSRSISVDERSFGRTTKHHDHDIDDDVGPPITRTFHPARH
jgi:hypothetical protein